MSRARSPEESRRLGREKLLSWLARLSQLGIPSQASLGDSHTDPAPVAAGQPDSTPKSEFPVQQKRRTALSRLFMKVFSKRGSRKLTGTNEGPATLVREQPDKTAEQNNVMREDTVDQVQAFEKDVESEIEGNISLQASGTSQGDDSRAAKVEEGPQAGQGSPVQPDPAHQAEDGQTILAKSIQDFAERKPDMFKLLKDEIEHFRSLGIESCDTWSNIGPAGESESPQAAWVSRCKARLPAFSAVKSLAVRASALDPHGLAPYIVTGSFVAIELLVGIIDPTNRDKALDMILKTSIIIKKWESCEIDLVQIKSSREPSIVYKVKEIEKLLEKLYEQGLTLIASIYYDGKNKFSQAVATVTCGPVKWKEQLDKLDSHNSRCTEMKSEVDKMLQRKEDNMAILNWIRCKDDPEPTHEDMRLKTGLEPTSQNTRLAGFSPVTNEVQEWFLQMSQFSSWVGAIVQEQHVVNRVCWLRGIIGTGKSTLMCRVISHYNELPLAGVRFIHYYCDASKAPGTPPPDYETIIRALCCRLAWCNDGRLAEPAFKLHGEYNPKYARPDSKPTINEWKALLHDLIASSVDRGSRIIFVIDALDEYRSLSDCRQLLGFLADLRSKPWCPYIFLSSRKHVPVANYFDSELEMVDLSDNIKLPQVQADIKSVIDHTISLKEHDPAWKRSIFLSDQYLRQRLKAALIASAGGMFRWVQVWLGVFFPKNKKCIEKRSTAEDLLKKLETFQTLDDLGEGDLENAMKTAYANLWEVNGDPQYQIDQLRAFRIVLAASQSLTPNQLLEAVRFNPEDPDGYDESFEFHQLEGLYHNFLKQNESGCLEFEHVSASRFVLELKTDHDEPIFSAIQNSRFMADFGIKAIERPGHSIWSISNLDLVQWSERARKIGFTFADSEVRPILTPTRKIALHIPRTKFNNPDALKSVLSRRFPPEPDLGTHFAGCLLRDWADHCQIASKDDNLNQRIVALSQNESTGFDGYLLMAGLGQFVDQFNILELTGIRRPVSWDINNPPYNEAYPSYCHYLRATCGTDRNAGNPCVKIVLTKDAENEEEATVLLPPNEKTLDEVLGAGGYCDLLPEFTI